MKYNGEITREKRKNVNGLRKKKKELHDKLERLVYRIIVKCDTVRHSGQSCNQWVDEHIL